MQKLAPECSTYTKTMLNDLDDFKSVKSNINTGKRNVLYYIILYCIILSYFVIVSVRDYLYLFVCI